MRDSKPRFVLVVGVDKKVDHFCLIGENLHTVRFERTLFFGLLNILRYSLEKAFPCMHGFEILINNLKTQSLSETESRGSDFDRMCVRSRPINKCQTLITYLSDQSIIELNSLFHSKYYKY